MTHVWKNQKQTIGNYLIFFYVDMLKSFLYFIDFIFFVALYLYTVKIMNEPSKKPPRIAVNRITALVTSIQADNTRNHRQYVPQTSYNNYTTQEQNKTKNGKSSEPKPLLECLQPEPLLISKPFEKSTSQRRRKNKPFDPENLGENIR